MKEERFQKHLSEKDALLCVCVAEAGTEMLKETDTLAVPFNQITQDMRGHCSYGRENHIPYLTYNLCFSAVEQRSNSTLT